jgi:hypothetical protein
MAKFFKKEIPSRPLHLPIGRALEFDHYDDDYGYLKTEDGYIIQELMSCIARGQGGVSEVTEEEYLDWLKKNSNGTLSRLPRRARETIGPSQLRRGVGPGAVPADIRGNGEQTIIGHQNSAPVTDVATPQRSEGLKVERSFVKPTVGKIQT